MQNTNAATLAPVYEYGSRDYHYIMAALYPDPTPWLTADQAEAEHTAQEEARRQLPACVLVGKFASYESGHQGSATIVDKGTPVLGIAAGGRVVYDSMAWARDIYEPDTVNKIGGRGAYRPTPAQDRIDTNIAAARAAITR